MDRHSITLKKPVTLNGETITSLNLREPNGGDIERMEDGKGSPIAKSYQLIANLAEVDPQVPRLMSTLDLHRVNRWLEPHLNPKDLPED